MIAGAGRSGSTLLERILAQAPGTVTVGELTEIWQRGLIEDRRCGCGERFSSCQFWTDVGERAFGGWDRVDPQRMVELERKLRWRGVPLSPASGISASRRRAADEYGATLVALYRAVAERSGARLIIDASKWPRHLFVLRRIPIELTVIHLFRDPRAVAYSWSRDAEEPHGASDAARMRVYRPVGSAVRWLLFNLLVDLAARRGTPTRRVRYERLVAHPLPVLEDLGERLGMSGGTASLPIDAGGCTVVLGPSHGIAGNPMRFRQGRFALRTDERWRSALPAGQRLIVGALCGPLYRSYSAGC